MRCSLITVCYNPGLSIHTAMESVASQTYRDIEHILVDGGSTDGTPEMLKAWAASRQQIKILSEPDKGIYDALNKGVGMATGDIIGFVHADDLLAEDDVVGAVVETFNRSHSDGVYGDLVYVREAPDRQANENRKTPPASPEFSTVRYWKAGPFSGRSLQQGWMPPHPALYLRREVYEKAKLPNGEYFDTSFRIAGDYDFMTRILNRHEISLTYLPRVLVKMRVGGTSNRSLKNLIQKSREDYRAMKQNGVGGLWTLLCKNFRKVPQFFAREG